MSSNFASENQNKSTPFFFFVSRCGKSNSNAGTLWRCDLKLSRPSKRSSHPWWSVTMCEIGSCTEGKAPLNEPSNSQRGPVQCQQCNGHRDARHFLDKPALKATLSPETLSPVQTVRQDVGLTQRSLGRGLR